MSAPPKTTWDGLPVSAEKPHGSAVIVYRYNGGALEVLVLHRAHHGADYEGDWAWTPPSGARQPGEAVLAVACRELREETGLTGDPVLTDFGIPDWFVFALEVGCDAAIQLDAEHDRHEWVNPAEAIRRCRPERVAEPLRRFAQAMNSIADGPSAAKAKEGRHG